MPIRGFSLALARTTDSAETVVAKKALRSRTDECNPAGLIQYVKSRPFAIEANKEAVSRLRMTQYISPRVVEQYYAFETDVIVYE